MSKLTIAGMMTNMASLALWFLLFGLILLTHAIAFKFYLDSSNSEAGLFALIGFLPHNIIFPFCWIAIIVGISLMAAGGKEFKNRKFSVIGLVMWIVLVPVALILIMPMWWLQKALGMLGLVYTFYVFLLVAGSAAALYIPLHRFLPKWSKFALGGVYALGFLIGIVLTFYSGNNRILVSLLPVEAAHLIGIGLLIFFCIQGFLKVRRWGEEKMDSFMKEQMKMQREMMKGLEK